MRYLIYNFDSPKIYRDPSGREKLRIAECTISRANRHLFISSRNDVKKRRVTRAVRRKNASDTCEEVNQMQRCNNFPDDPQCRETA